MISELQWNSSSHAHALLSHFVADPALSNVACWGRHAFRGALKCSLFPPTTQRPCRASSSVPAHLLPSLPTPPFLFPHLHPSSQDALYWSCGPCTYCPALSLTRGSQHTHFNTIPQCSHSCCCYGGCCQPSPYPSLHFFQFLTYFSHSFFHDF